MIITHILRVMLYVWEASCELAVHQLQGDVGVVCSPRCESARRYTWPSQDTLWGLEAVTSQQHSTWCMQEQYADETFVHVLPAGQIPHTRHVRGSNFTYISVFPDRLPGRAIIIAGICTQQVDVSACFKVLGALMYSTRSCCQQSNTAAANVVKHFSSVMFIVTIADVSCLHAEEDLHTS